MFALGAERGFLWSTKIAIVLLLTSATSCFLDSQSASSGVVPDANPAKVKARFELGPSPMRFGDIPWPDDLYRDDKGRIRLGHLSQESTDNAFFRSLRDSLPDVDGFGAMSPIYFYFTGEVDPSSIDSKNVFLIDLETGSPESLKPIPIINNWNITGFQNRRIFQLAIRPVIEHPLRSGHKYAAVITRALRATDGSGVGPADSFAAIRDAKPADTTGLLAAAYNEYAPVVSLLEHHKNLDIKREDIAALAVFTVRDIDTDMKAVRKIVRGQKPPTPLALTLYAGKEALDQRLGDSNVVGLAPNMGAPHDHIGWMIHGTFPAPYFLARTANGVGSFIKDSSGVLQVKLQGEVPFSLWLPNGAFEHPLPVVIFQHGLGAERSDALAVADALTKSGFAVFAIDAPFHGMRAHAVQVDSTNRFTGVPQRDGFGDVRAMGAIRRYVGLAEGENILADFNQDGATDSLHPYYWRDATRQGVVDLMMAMYLLQEGDWSGLANMDERLKKLHFNARRVGFLGIDVGGQMAIILASFEPAVSAVLLEFTGGGIAEYIIESPAYENIFAELAQQVGREESLSDPAVYNDYHPLFWPEIGVWQTLVNDGDALSYAYNLRAQPTAVWMTMVPDDEVVNHLNTVGLGQALGVSVIEDEQDVSEVLSNANFIGDSGSTLRALFEFESGTHDLLLTLDGELGWEHPIKAPFNRSDPRQVTNPTEAALNQVDMFFSHWYAAASSQTDAVTADR